MKSAAYYEGYNACYDGLSASTNPYSWVAGSEYDDFAEGYADAEREMRAEYGNAKLEAEEYSSIYD